MDFRRLLGLGFWLFCLYLLPGECDTETQIFTTLSTGYVVLNSFLCGYLSLLNLPISRMELWAVIYTWKWHAPVPFTAYVHGILHQQKKGMYNSCLLQ